MSSIYIRTLKRAEHTVFCVADGQKYYYDTQFNRRIPYSSGQQVKRSILESLCENLGIAPSPTTFYWDVTKDKTLKEGEAFGTCDPSYPDQLLGGWMRAAKGGKDRTLKRRSPLSISAMRGLHPLLAGLNTDSFSFARSDRPNNVIVVRDEKGNIMSDEAVATFLEGKDRSLNRKFGKDKLSTVSGLFVMDVAIDLRRLFTVSLNSFEPEMADETIEKLKTNGWANGENVFGPCLVAPEDIRKKWAGALASAIINWRITSNQARTFSLMETLAVAISDNANLIAGSVRAKLSEEDSNKAVPIVQEGLNGVDTFITLNAGGYMQTASEKADALEQAEKKLIELIEK